MDFNEQINKLTRCFNLNNGYGYVQQEILQCKYGIINELNNFCEGNILSIPSPTPHQISFSLQSRKHTQNKP